VTGDPRGLAALALGTGGRGRTVVVAGTTAATTALLLTAVSVARLEDAVQQDGVHVAPGNLVMWVSDDGTRPGVVLALGLLVVPLLLLLDQAVRLGSAARRRRGTALRLAGAGPAALARWGAVEVGVPAAAGALLGLPLWWALRALLQQPISPIAADGSAPPVLLPVGASPGFWAVPVVLGVAVFGAVVGARGGRRSPTLDERAPRTGGVPRPWGLLPLVTAVVMLLGPGRDPDVDQLWVLVAVALVVVGLVLLVPTVVGVAAALGLRLARTPASLLALRRLQVDAGAAGRAAGAVAAVGATAGVLALLLPDLLEASDDVADYVLPVYLVALLGAAAALLAALSLGLHAFESVTDRRRQLASLVATGTPVGTLATAQRREALLAVLPAGLLGFLVGAVGFWALTLSDGLSGMTGEITRNLAAAAVGLTVLVTAAALLATAVSRRALRAVVDPEVLRTS